jgi:LuxR family transcriptional regulator, maltose regulon positive regulatory protein
VASDISVIDRRPASTVELPSPGDRSSRDRGRQILRVLPFGLDRDLELDEHRLGVGRLKIIELVSLLALSPHGVPRSEVARQLFPDSEPRQAGNYFRQVTHKLREATGIGIVRRYPNLIVMPDNVALVSADAELEAAIAAPQLSWADACALRLLLDQIHGRYLENSTLPWAELRRHRVEVIEEQARLTLARLQAAQGLHPAAREQCELVLSRNRYSDSAYRLLVSIERASGTEVSCMAVYRRAAEALREIGLRPGDARRLFQAGALADAQAVRTA